MYATLPSEDRAYNAENGARADLVGGRVLRVNLEGAREALLPVFVLSPAQCLAGIAGRLDWVRDLLGAGIFRTSHEARQLATDITEFAADTTGPALPQPDL